MKIAICDDEPVMQRELKRHLDKYAQERNIIFQYVYYTMLTENYNHNVMGGFDEQGLSAGVSCVFG